MFHIRFNKKRNHLFDGNIRVCDNGEYDAFDRRHPFVLVGKLDAKKITCKKCMSKLQKLVMREIKKALGKSKI